MQERTIYREKKKIEKHPVASKNINSGVYAKHVNQNVNKSSMPTEM